MSDVAEIAAGLTEAQKAAILKCVVKPAANDWVRDKLGLDGDFECYVGDGLVSTADFDGIRHLFYPVGARDPRGAATLFGNVYPPGLAVRAYLAATPGDRP